MKSFLRGLLNVVAFTAIAYASYLLILLSLPFIHFEPEVDFLATKQLIYHIRPWRVSFYVHVFSSPFVIIAGLLQFSRWIMYNAPKIHRISGYIYILILLFISGPAAFIMSLYANGGYIAQVSFVTLSILWLIFTFFAYKKIRNHDYIGHVKWNIRSFSLTLAAVSLRFYAYLFDVFNVNLGPRETYIVIAYISWIPNLIFAELLILLKYPQYLLKGKSQT